jgi:hypothetical protein
LGPLPITGVAMFGAFEGFGMFGTCSSLGSLGVFETLGTLSPPCLVIHSVPLGSLGPLGCLGSYTFGTFGDLGSFGIFATCGSFTNEYNVIWPLGPLRFFGPHHHLVY